MPVPHSSTPWKVHPNIPTLIIDAQNNAIVSVTGSNEQSRQTALYIVESVNGRVLAETAAPLRA